MHADVYTLSAVNYSPNLDPKTAQSGYALFNASLGLGGANEKVSIQVQGDASSVYLDKANGRPEEIQVRDVVHVFHQLGLTSVDLFKINIEGGEYPLLNRMLDADLVSKVRFFQVQYHGIGVDDPAAARDKIRERLSTTHREEWCVNGGQWESWALR